MNQLSEKARFVILALLINGGVAGGELADRLLTATNFAAVVDARAEGPYRLASDALSGHGEWLNHVQYLA